MADESSQLVAITSPDLMDQLDVSPETDLESWRLTVPAKGAGYVLEDAGGAPVLLATCADLRHALVRRLGPPGQEQEQPTTKRIDYRAVVRRVRWRPVYSRFEANWTYLENARVLLPRSYKRLIRHWRAYWLSVSLDDPHPRFIATDTPPDTHPRTCFGPLPDGRTARKLVEMLEDVFDLCRYHQILAQAPQGQACAYKQMGRCPAPCDGTVAMEVYREQVRRAADFLVQPRQEWLERVTAAMKAAAAGQRFEEASRYKRQIEQVKSADSAGGRLAPLTEMKWVTLQRGDRKGSIRAFLISPGAISFAGQIDASQCDELLPQLTKRAAELLDAPIDSGPALAPAGAERIALAAWHLLHADREPGVYLHAREAMEIDRLRAAVEQVVGAPAITAEQPSAI